MWGLNIVLFSSLLQNDTPEPAMAFAIWTKSNDGYVPVEVGGWNDLLDPR
jgi:hypothetical protein